MINIKLSKEEIEVIITNESAINSADLLVELGECYILPSNFGKEIDRVEFSRIVKDFIERNDIRISVDSKKFLNVSQPTVRSILKGEAVKDATLIKVYQKIGEYGQLNLE